MALTADHWHTLTFKSPANAAWTSYTPPFPDLPSVLGAALISGASFKAFCIGSISPTLYMIVEGMPSPIYLDPAVVNTSTTETTEVTTMDNGDVWYSMRDGDGTWRLYRQNANFVFTLASPTSLSAFLS